MMNFSRKIVIAAIAISLLSSTVYCCSAWDWIKCAAIVAGCAAACVDPLDGVCEACMGSLYSECVGCVTVDQELGALVTLQGTGVAQLSEQKCSSVNWVRCASELRKCEILCQETPSTIACASCTDDYQVCVNCVPQIIASAVNETQLSLAAESGCSPWDWIKCAAKVAECGATCASNGVTSSECRNCFGPAFSQCAGCLSLSTTIQDQLQGCSVGTWLQCAGELASCTSECIDNGLTSPQCFHCLGSSYDECIGCISSDDQDDIVLLAQQQQLAVQNGVAPGIHFSIGVLIAATCAGVVLKSVAVF